MHVNGKPINEVDLGVVGDGDGGQGQDAGVGPGVVASLGKPPEGSPYDGFRDEQGLIMGKYKDEAAFIQGYRELSKKLTEKSPEIPEVYEPVQFEDFENAPEALKGVVLDTKDPTFEALAPVFKELKLTQEGVKKLIGAYLTHELSHQPSLDVVRKELGQDADNMLGEINTFINRAFPDMAGNPNLTESNQAMRQALAGLGGSADGVRALHRLIGMSQERPIPSHNALGVPAPKDLEAAKQEVYAWRTAQKDFMSNPAKKKEFDRRMRAIYEGH